MRGACWLLSGAVASLIGLPGAAARQEPPERLTVAETSGFTRTSTSQEVEEYLQHYGAAEHIELLEYGRTVEERPLTAAMIARPLVPIEQRDERLRVLVIGNIHSGECDGKEALLILLRRLAAAADHPWLDSMVLLLAPNYNADGNDRMGKDHRPGQDGPVEGMGIRENAQQLDLNRDFVKLESPEARALVRLIDTFDPHVFIDCHTTDGSLHQYGLTYDVPHNPASPEPIRAYLRSDFMPAVTETLAGAGLLTYYYGNFNQRKDQWLSFGHEPRYSTEYVGLRGRIGILSESYAHATYEQRIVASDQFVSACLDRAHQQAPVIRRLLEEVENAFVAQAGERPEGMVLPLAAQMRAFPDPVEIKAWDESGGPRDYRVEFVGDFQPTRSTEYAWAYLLPRRCSRQAELLRRHGIAIEALREGRRISATHFRINQINRSPQPFQRHAMVALEATSRGEAVDVEAGTYLIRTAQPLGRLAAYLLEPMSDDGLTTWNFFDRELKVDGVHPVLRLDSPDELLAEPVTQIESAEELSLDELYGPLAAAPRPRPSWLPSGDAYLLEWDGWDRRLMQVDRATGALARYQVADRGQLRAALEGVESLDAEARDALLAATPRLTADGRRGAWGAGRHLVCWDRAAAQIAWTAEAATDLVDWEISSDGSLAALVAGNDLYVVGSNESLWRVTEDGGPLKLNGRLDWVYQEELYGRGNYRGFWIEPAGEHIAFLSFDETGVPTATADDPAAERFSGATTPYPKPGDPLPKVVLRVARRADRSQQEVDLSRYAGEEVLITAVGWSAHGRGLHFLVQNRGQTWVDLCRFDPQSAGVEVLFREESPAWLRTPPLPVELRDGTLFWLSGRAGYQHIYRFAAGRWTPWTRGPWQVSQIHGVDEDEQYLYFSGTIAGPLRTQVYRGSLAAGAIERLTDPLSSHAADFSPDLKFFFDTSSRFDQLPRTVLRDARGPLVRVLDHPVDEWLAFLRPTPSEFVELPTPIGGVIDAQLIKPAGFDPAKKYPVIVQVYGGPQSPMVQDVFRGSNSLWLRLMAQRGFVIWVCDTRSASRRGLAPAWDTWGRLGWRELGDLECGLDWLQAQPWVDAERIGIWGWSYGGFLTAYAMTHSWRFRAGVAGAPVTDWRSYDAIYTERLMKLPAENADGYAEASVVAAAESLHGRLLLVHGTMDDNVPLSNTLQLAEALQRAGKPFELMLYPGNRHGVSVPEQQRHLWQTITDFFVEQLRPTDAAR